MKIMLNKPEALAEIMRWVKAHRDTGIREKVIGFTANGVIHFDYQGRPLDVVVPVLNTADVKGWELSDIVDRVAAQLDHLPCCHPNTPRFLDATGEVVGFLAEFKRPAVELTRAAFVGGQWLPVLGG